MRLPLKAMFQGGGGIITQFKVVNDFIQTNILFKEGIFIL